MEIGANTTSMLTDLAVATDKHGRDRCVVVIKGTFAIAADGTPHLADQQEPLVYADRHYGDPSTTSIQYECDFAPSKPRADVIINGSAFSRGDVPVSEMLVGLEVNQVRKIVRVVGNRHWLSGVGLKSRPEPFITMALLYERAFGGLDQTHPNPNRHGVELRNPVGVGFHRNSDPSTIVGTPLPNLEDPKNPILAWSHRPVPVGFGTIGRGWQPRISFAGTYDDAWLNDRFPFLPDDFDDQYFLSSPVDQQIPFLKGGEVVRCANMAPQRIVSFSVPSVHPPVLFRFQDKNIESEPNLDTLIVEPDQHRFIAIWRATVPLGRKLRALREVRVGNPILVNNQRRRNGKPYFRSLSDLVKWRHDVRR